MEILGKMKEMGESSHFIPAAPFLFVYIPVHFISFSMSTVSNYYLVITNWWVGFDERPSVSQQVGIFHRHNKNMVKHYTSFGVITS